MQILNSLQLKQRTSDTTGTAKHPIARNVGEAEVVQHPHDEPRGYDSPLLELCDALKVLRPALSATPVHGAREEVLESNDTHHKDSEQNVPVQLVSIGHGRRVPSPATQFIEGGAKKCRK